MPTQKFFSIDANADELMASAMIRALLREQMSKLSSSRHQRGDRCDIIGLQRMPHAHD